MCPDQEHEKKSENSGGTKHKVAEIFESLPYSEKFMDDLVRCLKGMLVFKAVKRGSCD